MQEVFNVSYISTSDCFFYLNDRSLEKFKRNGELINNCIKIEYGVDFGECTYSSLASYSNNVIENNCIGLSAVRAELLGIKENDNVLLSITNAPQISAVHVRPQDDLHHELIIKNCSVLVNSLLEQVKVVTVGEIIPIQAVNNIVINLKVEKLCPESHYGELQNRTEMIIIDPSEAAEIGSISEKPLADFEEPRANNAMNSKSKGLFREEYEKQPSNHFPSSFWNLLKYLLNKVSTNSFVNSNSYSADAEMATVLSGDYGANKSLKLRIASLFFAPKEIQEMTGGNLAFAYGLPSAESTNSPCCLRISKLGKNGESITDNNSSFSNESSLFPYCTFVYAVTVSDNGYQSNDLLYVPDRIMKLLNVPFGSVVLVEQVDPIGNVIENNLFCYYEPSVSNMVEGCFPQSLENIYKNAIRTVMDNIKFNQKVNTLITGSTGSGKTYLLNSLSDYFEEKMLFCLKFDCKPLRKLKISNLEKLLIENLSECCRCQPSVMLLDDLDALTMEDEEGNPYSTMYSARVGALIIDLITSYQSLNEITVIATGNSLARFKDMSTDRGPIIFENINEIDDLIFSERAVMLRRLISSAKLDVLGGESVIEDISNNTNGYNVQDLVDLIKVAEIKCLLRNSSDEGMLNREDFELALADKVPLSLYGVKLQKKTLKKWEDIGGMEESKNLLREMFEWPLKYQELYKSCPLRLQCGVLLYGAPGTGKTLIAGAVANEFGLNFISIKGPEVFSKYVGASEQGIRDLFSRARRAKPCLLFFDEFDSLARRRGSSNEDVNDRVVNQLLTELDGVEELTGVYILAATSRPDLLDPALLRPGRIDRIVHCKLPTEVERVSILKALLKDMKFSDDVNLEEIAKKTDGYSGADLKAVLYATQATLVKEIGKQKGASPHLEIVLKQSYLLTGVAETKPSISKQDRKNYDSSYEAFIASRTGRSFQQSGKLEQKIMFA